VIVYEYTGALGRMPDTRVVGVTTTDRDGRFQTSLTDVRGPLDIRLVHEHCDWYGASTIISFDEIKKAHTLQVSVKTKREICPDSLQPFFGQ
jgi:hypothetical protein